MGNCLEPSESEILKARHAKAREMERNGISRGGQPKMLHYPPPLAGYPGPSRAPSSFVAMDRRTGQQYLVHYPDTPDVYYGNPRLPGYAGMNGGFVSGPGRRESWPLQYGVELPKENRRRSDVANLEVHDFKGQKKHRHPIDGLFTNAGVVDFPEEEEIILDYIDPDPVTITTAKKDYKPAEEESNSPNHVTENSKPLPSPPQPNGDINLPPNNESDVLPTNSVFETLPPPPPPSPPPNNDVVTRSRVGFSDDIDMINVSSNSKNMAIVYEEVRVEKTAPGVPEPVRSLPDIFKPSANPAASLPFDPVDVVITYSVLGEYELGIVRKLTRQLEQAGLTVWAERLGDSSRARKSEKTAQSILVAKVLIVLLSEGSCEQRFIRDHVAIATMANIAIFPVASEPPQEVLNAMPLELKVQLSPYKWEELTDGNEDSFLFQLRSLARSVHDAVDEHKDLKSARMTPRGSLLQRRQSLPNAGLTANAASFWDVHFGHRDNVKWERLMQAITNEYKVSIGDVIPREMQALLFLSLQNRLTDPHMTQKTSDVVYRNDFVDLCQTSHGVRTDVWETMIRIVGLLQAVRDVLEEGSTVRPLVAEYVEHFSSPEMAKAIYGLLSDPDPNLRATAVVSLARCVTSPSPASVEIVKRTLKDDDYLVREAGCLALGYLKDESTVKDLLHVWGNDLIFQVREAAKVSLEQIGGQEVVEAMKDADVSSASTSTNENGPFTFRGE